MIPRTIFSPDHEAFRDTVRRFIAEHVVPHHADWEKAGQVPRQLWLEAGKLGLLCCNVPEEYGGMGGDFLHSTILIEEMARVGATGPTFYLHSDIVAPYLVDFGTEAQKLKWLPKMATGEVVVALGMSEPSGGSDVQAMRTQALREGDSGRSGRPRRRGPTLPRTVTSDRRGRLPRREFVGSGRPSRPVPSARPGWPGDRGAVWPAVPGPGRSSN